ncbi:tyrosine-type recombinase/integrase [Schinkia azotoformans]|uniref:tyrosine-type recombinase/integrase n=1 Tax=Schinkia azotoformans TaxID=1454 RepID=UPI002DB75EAF|nr:tyrosine-type recombinase/integrase [Schinkia azotoformans]MEC1714619.1 tyrosine-type recombinase/integrase [Schinkia azotoformans]MEC1742930.1 tyrosine-type recombinase/integrase [Schinkia azotoformans]MEC1745393.1 tyrosine-type recombinase/integrase [Schinkia azotoformans]MEC1757092.1 tyrosine-type recombinase/integrase [Schinkia azotoformans]MEC1768269.1 tyrosine-type recombinase/integrase [Schinkia azotoformans]
MSTKAKRVGIRKFKREVDLSKNIDSNLTMNEMFERFMMIKKSEILAKRTIDEYLANYRYFLEYTGGDVTSEQITTELFCGYIAYMRDERDLAPNTINIRVRTMRSFIRYCYEDKGWIQEPIHKRFKTVKVPIDNVEAFTPEEVKKIIGVIDESSYTGWRSKVIIFTLLDTLVRVGELIEIKRQNVNLKNRTIHLEANETKTRVARTVPISIKTAKLIDEYITETTEFNSEYLFVSYEGEKLTESTIRGNIVFVNNELVLTLN